MSADLLQFFHSGAERVGDTQAEQSLSLGGNLSATVARSLRGNRPFALPGLIVEYISGSNGIGNGSIEVIDDDVITWTPPGGSAGAEVTILSGETLRVFGNDTDKYIEVRRLNSTALRGQEVIQCVDIFNDVFSGSDFNDTEAAIGEDKYRGGFFYNRGALSMTNVLIWLESTMAADVRIAAETPAANVIQTIADEFTQPTGRTWVNPTTEGTALTLASLAAGAASGLWIEQSTGVSTPVNARTDTILHYKFTYDGADYYGQWRGLNSILQRARLLFFSETHIPNPDIDTEKVNQAIVWPPTYPINVNYSASYAQGNYFRAVYLQNRYGLISAASLVSELPINVGGTEDEQTPSAPSEIQILPGADGVGVVSALYQANLEGATAAEIAAKRATHWALWFSGDGHTIDPEVDTPDLVEAMDTLVRRENLNWTSPENLDGAPMVVVVRARRVDGFGTWDSTNTDTATATASTVGPARVAAGLFFDAQYAMTFAGETGPSDTLTIDVTTNTRFVYTPGSTSFYIGTTLIWRMIYDGSDVDNSKLYIPKTIALINDLTAFGAWGGAVSDPWQNVEVVDANTVYICTHPDQVDGANAGTRRIKIDLTTSTIRFAKITNSQTLNAFM